MTPPKPPGPSHITVRECSPSYPNKGWLIFGDVRGRCIQRGAVFLDDAGGEVTVIGHCHMRMISGPNKWGWIVDRELPVGTTLREVSNDDDPG